MYQIFVVDKDSPHYNAANTDNPYKFFAGVGYDGEKITGVWDDGIKIHRENNKSEHACYLGGGYGITTSNNEDYKRSVTFKSSYTSQVYSNHQIGDSN
jgi:hypothetical protein